MTGFLGLKSMSTKIDGKLLYDQISKLTNLTTYHSRDLLIKLFGLNFFNLGLRKIDREILALNKAVNESLMGYIKEYRN